MGVGTALRLILGSSLPDYSANAILFATAAAGFVLSAGLALRIPRHQLGPDGVPPASTREIAWGLVEAVRHLNQRRPAALGLLTIGAHRVVYGVVTVATILVYRNYFHAVTDVEAAIADLGILVVATGAGFVLAAVVTPPMSAWLGVRRWVVVSLLASGVLQVFPGAIYTKPALLVAAVLLGITAQSVKICVDTLVQAHVDDEVKGRVFVLYDVIFNVALVLAATIGALILPTDGTSVPILLGLAAVYLLTGAAFAVFSRGLDLDAGTESLRHDPVAAKPAD